MGKNYNYRITKIISSGLGEGRLGLAELRNSLKTIKTKNNNTNAKSVGFKLSDD